MRIIDKKHDFYDYLQDPTDTIVFDRRNSYNLTKEIICSNLHKWDPRDTRYDHDENKYRCLVLQACHTFWLFLLTVTDVNSENSVTNFTLELLYTWRDYNSERKLLDVYVTESSYLLKRTRIYKYKHIYVYDKDYISKTVDHIAHYISSRERYKNVWSINEFEDGNGVKRDIPILRPSGIGDLINPIDIFCSIEEYFSMKKTESETTEAKGATNDDKIIMHGFDTKASFRGK